MEKVKGKVKSSKRGKIRISRLKIPFLHQSTIVILFVLFLFVEEIPSINSERISVSVSARKDILQTPDFLYGTLANVVKFSHLRTNKPPAVAFVGATEKFLEQKQSVNMIKRIAETGKLIYCSILIYNYKGEVVDPINSEMYERNLTISSLNRDTYILNERDGFNKTVNENDNDNDTGTEIGTGKSRLNMDLLTNPLSKLKRLGANCILSLIFLPNTSNHREKVLQKVHDKLTTFPIISPWTKRNKDYYIFITNDPNEIKKILLSPHISFRFTYKLVIAISFPKLDSKSLVQEIEIVGKTLCFYCSHGSSLVIDINLSTNDNPNPNSVNRFFPRMLKNFHGGIIKASAISIGVSVQMQRGEPKEKGKNIDSNTVDVLDTEEWNWHPVKTGGTFLRSFISASESLNFTYRIRAGGGSGLKLKNGSYNGVIGDVLNGKVDVGVVTGITLSRLAILDFTSALDYLTLTFVHGPQEEIFSWKFVFRPFSGCLWTGIISTVVIAILFLIVLSFYERKLAMTLGPKKKVWTVERILLFILPTCLGQHFTRAEILSFRCFAGNWHLFIMVISTAYLSTLFGFFIYPPLESAPATFDELPISSYQLGITYYGGAIYSWFKNAPNGTTMHQIYRKMEKRKTLDCLIETLVQKYVCISYKTSILHAVRVELGDKYGRSSLVIENAVGFEIPVGLSLEKRSILIQSLSRVTSSNFECGLTTFWRTTTYDELRAERLQKEAEQMKNSTISSIINTSVDQVDNNGPIRLKINHFRGAFTIFIFGSCLAFIIFITEMTFSKIHRCNHILDKILNRLGVKFYIVKDSESYKPYPSDVVKRIECLPCF